MPFKIPLQRKYIPLIVGIILASIAGGMLVAYNKQRESTYKRKAEEAFKNLRENQIPVLVAKRDMPQGSVLRPNMVEVEIFPRQLAEPGAISSLGDIEAKQLISSLSKGEQITLAKLSRAIETSIEMNLSMLVPEGKRAVTISVDNISSLSGMIKPGDFVDVIGMIPMPMQAEGGKQAAQLVTVPLFQNVLVLAVGEEYLKMKKGKDGKSVFLGEMFGEKKKDKPKASPLITLALPLDEANIISFVQEQGKIRLLLRSSLDMNQSSPQPISWDYLFQYLVRIGALPSPEIREEKLKKKVEIYRGLEREVIELK